MDNRAEVKDFLTTRRERITPEDVGLPVVGSRRVKGLRRGEVATLAGVSVEYYSKIERGDLSGASPSVLEAIARALRMDEAEREHLFHLAAAAQGVGDPTHRPRRRRRAWQAPERLRWVLDAVTAGPAIVRNGRMDLLAWNLLGGAMHSQMISRTTPGEVPNFARYTFLDDDSHVFYRDWQVAADTVVAILHTEAGRDPHDREMHDLVGELSTRSSEFATRWARHEVRLHGSGTKYFHHPAVGDLDLAYESVDMASEPGLSLTIYAGEPASPTAERLRLLASWAAPELPAERPDPSRAEADR